MKIIGYILITIGGFWVLSRLLNQPLMLKNIKNGTTTLWGYLKAELVMGIGFGVLLIALGSWLAFIR